MTRRIALLLAVCLLGLLSNSESSAQDGNCPNAPTQLAVSMTARTNDPLKVRSGPGTNNPEIGKVTLDRTVRIIGGPACDGGWRWWQIQATDNSASGWSVEVGSGNVYLLLPDGMALGAHNRWDPGNPDAYQHPPTQSSTTTVDPVQVITVAGVDCQNEPYVGMKFYSYGGSMIGARVFESVADAANWHGFTGELLNAGYVGVIEDVGADRLFKEQPIDLNTAYRYQVLAGPQSYKGHQFWKVSLRNSPFEGWVLWSSQFCEFEETPSEFVIGWETPPSGHYGFVPPVISPAQLQAREWFDPDSRVMVSVTPGFYYSLLSIEQGWTLIGNHVGPIGWVRTGILQVPPEFVIDLYLEQALYSSDGSVEVYESLDQFPESALVKELMEKEGIKMSIDVGQVPIMSWRAWRNRELPSNSDVVCLVLMFESYRSDDPGFLVKNGEMLCAVWDIATAANPAFAWATFIANHDVTIDSWYWPAHEYIENNVSIACVYAWLTKLQVPQCAGYKPK